MKIGELAAETGVTTKTIRYYEGIGLLQAPARSPNGYRDYDPEAIGRLRFVRDAQETGLTLTEIAVILDLRKQGVGTCHHVVELLERHLQDLDRHIENLGNTRQQLITLTNRARALNPADCTDPNRCQTIEVGNPLGQSSRVETAHLHASPHRHTHL